MPPKVLASPQRTLTRRLPVITVAAVHNGAVVPHGAERSLFLATSVRFSAVALVAAGDHHSLSSLRTIVRSTPRSLPLRGVGASLRGDRSCPAVAPVGGVAHPQGRQRLDYLPLSGVRVTTFPPAHQTRRRGVGGMTEMGRVVLIRLVPNNRLYRGLALNGVGSSFEG